jgi:hypothetical protein
MSEELAKMLEKVAKAKAVKAEAEQVLREAKKELETVEGLAIEMLAASGLDRVNVAGRTWWSDEAMSLTVPKEVRDEVFDAAEAEGILEELMTVNTTTLKAWLVERAKEQGLSLENACEGTAFKGLLKGYCRSRLCSRAS